MVISLQTTSICDLIDGWLSFFFVFPAVFREYNVLKVSDSDSDASLSSRLSDRSYESSSEGEAVYAEGGFLPYQNEPLVEDGELSEENDDTDDQDPDPGITPEILRQRFEGEVDITNWKAYVIFCLVFRPRGA